MSTPDNEFDDLSPPAPPPMPAAGIDADVARLRVPPHSNEAEQSVLGGLLLDSSAWDKASDVVTASDFYRYEHRVIFQAIGDLAKASKPADVITVHEQLQSLGKAQECGGLAYLNGLAQSVPSAANLRRYAEIVRERAVLRKLIEASDEIATQAFNPQGRAVATILDESESRIFKIGEESERTRQGFFSIDKLVVALIDRVNELAENGAEEVTGVRTGFYDFDRMTAGLQPGDLVVLAARPSMGKAQPLDAKVRTPSGWKRMGELAVGDALASVDGRPSIVTGVHPQGERAVWRLTFSDGRSAEACDEHLWRVHHRQWSEPRVLSTAELRQLMSRKRHQNRLWIDMPSGDFGHDRPLPVDPWVLGSLLGDGCMTGTGTVRFSTGSTEMLQRLQARLPEGLETTEAGGHDHRVVQVHRGRLKGHQGQHPNVLRVALDAMGLSGCSSEEKFIPPLYLHAARAQRLDLLRGLLDADGWVERWGSIRFSTSSAQLARDVAELVRSLGGWCSIKTKTTRFKGTDGVVRQGLTAHVCNIAHPQPASLFLLSEKQLRCPAVRQRRKLPVLQKVEPSRVAPCQCISVSHPSKLYITDDHVVTHNTALAINIAENVAVEEGLPVVVFSMEMGAAQLALRMVGSIGRIDQQHLRTGALKDDEWTRLTEAVDKLAKANIFIDETPALNPAELRARARRQARTCGKLGLIVVDYLQLMSGSGSSEENRATELGEISRGLKALAKELQCPVIALSQLNRSVETRQDRRPMMSDLRECVTGETLVWLADGTRRPIAELVGTQPHVHAVNEQQQLITAQSDCVWRVGRKPVWRLTTASGRVLRATAEHRVLAGGGWTEMRQLSLGSRVALARRVAQPAVVQPWAEQELILLAHLVGDGSYLRHQPLRYTTASEDNSEAVRVAAQALGSTVSRHAGRGQWHQLVISGNGNRWHPAGVGAWLKRLGLHGQRSLDKHLPASLFQVPDEQVALFLRHLWATDGCISVRPAGQKGGARVYLATCSERLAREVAALLLRLGIVARLRSVVQRRGAPVWNVDVSGLQAQQRFLTRVGAFGPRLEPAKRLAEHLERLVGANTNVDTLPQEVFVQVQELMRARGVSQRAMAAARGTSYGGSSHFSFAPSREVLADYAHHLGSAELLKWAESDLFWDTVVALEPEGEEEVFDLTVPGPACWLADGLVTHNSGAIEQDADVIMFIYRDDYYNKENSKEPGVAEVIIAKQRNGPVGTVKLAFIKSHTKFENLAPGASAAEY